MTALTGSADCPPDRLAATRDGLHRVAEHVLAAARYAAARKIGLILSPGGFRTPPLGPDGRFLAVDGAELVVDGAQGARRTPLTTIRAAAEFTGVTPGAPAEVYRPATSFSLDEPLMIDPDAARLLAAWYQLGAQAMSRLAVEIPGDKPGAAVLWPEHFDVGMTAAAINYGASPGDEHITEPYLYVGPHDGPPRGDPAFWNAPFGAARTFRQIGTEAEAAAFFRDGRARAL
ncbi:MAG: hypothetical protein JWM19_609 [Actinomycetia bacterium]|nr:hypothetical protein [Actinomycetes bacterium]